MSILNFTSETKAKFDVILSAWIREESVDPIELVWAFALMSSTVPEKPTAREKEEVVRWLDAHYLEDLSAYPLFKESIKIEKAKKKIERGYKQMKSVAAFMRTQRR